MNFSHFRSFIFYVFSSFFVWILAFRPFVPSFFFVINTKFIYTMALVSYDFSIVVFSSRKKKKEDISTKIKWNVCFDTTSRRYNSSLFDKTINEKANSTSEWMNMKELRCVLKQNNLYKTNTEHQEHKYLSNWFFFFFFCFKCFLAISLHRRSMVGLKMFFNKIYEQIAEKRKVHYVWKSE